MSREKLRIRSIASLKKSSVIMNISFLTKFSFPRIFSRYRSESCSISKSILKWIKEDGFDEKLAVASSLVSSMIDALLGEDCSREGRIRSKRLGELLQHFEDLLATTRGGIAKKFYRDHLNHMLRVMLLANAFGKHVEPFSLSDEEARLLTLAGLVHDIAYPLSESYQFFNEAIQAMAKCYKALSFPNFRVSYDMERVTRLLETLNLKETPLSYFGPFLNRYSHGIMGAMEFADYISHKKLKQYARLLQVIVFHDSSLVIPRSLQKDSMLMALVLSDEIQDWGRPAGLDKEPAISELKNFSINSHTIQGDFEWRNIADVSPLRQINSKVINFNRFTWPRSLHVMLTFKLPDYEFFDINRFEDIVRKLVEFCEDKCPEALNRFNKSWKSNREFFQSFYGNALPRADDLPRHLYERNASSKQKSGILFSSKCKEILHTSRKVKRLDYLRLEIHAGGLKLVVKDEQKEGEGSLHSQTDNLGRELAEDLEEKLIIFHGLSTRISSKKDGLIERYPYPSKEIIAKSLQTLGFNEDKDQLVENVRDLRRCLVDNGFFSFQMNEV